MADFKTVAADPESIAPMQRESNIIWRKVAQIKNLILYNALEVGRKPKPKSYYPVHALSVPFYRALKLELDIDLDRLIAKYEDEEKTWPDFEDLDGQLGELLVNNLVLDQTHNRPREAGVYKNLCQ